MIRYCENPGKTEERKLISGVGCFEHMDDELDAKTAWKEFLAVDAAYGQLDESKRFYIHCVQSFAPGELTEDPETAHAVGVETAKRLWPDRQTLVATHVDHDNHIHNHFVVNTVSYDTGKKLHTNKRDLETYKSVNDEICISHGLSTPQKGKHHDGSKLKEGTVSTYSKDKYHTVCCGGVKSYVSDCYEAYKAALATADSKEEFVSCMQDLGWTVSWTDTRKNISFSDADGHKVRDTNLAKTFNDPISKTYLEERFTQIERKESIGDKAAEEIGTIRGKVICQEYELMRYESLIKKKDVELSAEAKNIARAEQVIKDTQAMISTCEMQREKLCNVRESISPIRIAERRKIDQQIMYQDRYTAQGRKNCADTLMELGYSGEDAVTKAHKLHDQKKHERDKIHDRWRKAKEQQKKAIKKYAQVLERLAYRIRDAVLQKCHMLREKMTQDARDVLKRKYQSKFDGDRFDEAVKRADQKLDEMLSGFGRQEDYGREENRHR